MSAFQFQLTIGTRPSAAIQTGVLASLQLVTIREDALPVGKEAILRAGGKLEVKTTGKKGEGSFPEDRIKIPEGVNPDNLKDYTLYDMLGFTPEWADSADAEAIKKAYHKAVLMYHPDKAQ